jgi:hypothetical protein
MTTDASGILLVVSRKNDKEYNASPAGKERRRRYRASVKGKEERRRHWLWKGWASRRSRVLAQERQRILADLEALNQEAEDLGLA